MKIQISTPTKGDYTAGYVQSLVGTQAWLSGAEIPAVFRQAVGFSDLATARDVLACDFLESDCSHALLIDADQAWERDSIAKLVDAVRDHDVQFVAGVYPSWKGTYACELNEQDKGSLVGLDAVGLGFVLVSRKAYEAIVEADLAPEYESTDGRTLRMFHAFAMHEGERRGEDWWLCRHLQKAGVELWCDPNIVVSHTVQRTLTGCMAKGEPFANLPLLTN